jgi:hypothetical protein
MSDEDAAENAQIAAHDERQRHAIDGLTMFLNWWDANPNDQVLWTLDHPALWARFLELPLLAAPQIGADGLSDRARAQLCAIADKIVRCGADEYVDHAYLCEDVLYRLDTLTGRRLIRGQRVDFP